MILLFCILKSLYEFYLWFVCFFNSTQEITIAHVCTSKIARCNLLFIFLHLRPVCFDWLTLILQFWICFHTILKFESFLLKICCLFVKYKIELIFRTRRNGWKSIQVPSSSWSKVQYSSGRLVHSTVMVGCYKSHGLS